jgi:hypothetical protein
VYWARPSASFRDVVTINHPTLNGSEGLLTITYRVDASQMASGQNQPEPFEWGSSARIDTRVTIGIYVEDGFWQVRPDGTVRYGDTGNIYNAPRMFTARFTFGQPFYLGLRVLGSTTGYTSRPWNHISDAENTATWGGFNSVTDVSGNPITGYTVTSDSGANYTQPIPAALQATGAVSRKTHGSAGAFDVPLPGIESRTGGAGGDHTIVFTFSDNVTSGSASVSSGTGSVAGSPTFSGNTMTVNLTGVTNAQTVTVNLSNVAASSGQTLAATSRTVGFLAGDSNGDAVVNGGDAIQTRSRSGQDTGAANFRSDVNADGVVNSGDTIAVRSRSGTGL